MRACISLGNLGKGYVDPLSKPLLRQALVAKRKSLRLATKRSQVPDSVALAGLVVNLTRSQAKMRTRHTAVVWLNVRKCVEKDLPAR